MPNITVEGGIERFLDFDNTGGEVKRMPLKNLPIIDLSPFSNGADLVTRQRVGREIREACVNIGFFYLTGHGIPNAELDEVIEWGHRFWALPLEERMKLQKTPESRGLGFVPSGGTNAGYDTTVDTREVFSMSREVMENEPEEGRHAAGRTRWPSELLLPGYKAFIQAHIQKRQLLTKQLLQGFALSLELDEDYFEPSHHFVGCNLVYNYYPATDPAKMGRTQWAISPHTDYGTVTLLWQDKLGGLEVRNAAGDWIAAPPIDGAFVVNIGDLFARWTNDLYSSNLHRAVNYNSRARISVPFFVYPRANFEVECLATCQSAARPARYEKVRADTYVMALLEQSRRTGRAGVSTQAAERMKTQ
ncbi:MAG: isopenicillin N synthase family dioxygenase [Burkholderiales bacterium]